MFMNFDIQVRAAKDPNQHKSHIFFIRCPLIDKPRQVRMVGMTILYYIKNLIRIIKNYAAKGYKNNDCSLGLTKFI